MGAALLTGVGVKIWSSVDPACREVVRVAERMAPQPAALVQMNTSYAAYRMYPATMSVLAGTR
jgi:hypothetical protein